MLVIRLITTDGTLQKKKKKHTILELHFHVIIFKNEEVRVACFFVNNNINIY
jgi:hypothetical protein